MMVESAARKGKDRKTVVFMFSDGETTNGSTLQSFKDLGRLIDNGAVLGYGTENGGAMYYPGRGYIRNNTDGGTALSRIDETTLRQIAGDLSVPYINETKDPGASLARQSHPAAGIYRAAGADGHKAADRRSDAAAALR